MQQVFCLFLWHHLNQLAVTRRILRWPTTEPWIDRLQSLKVRLKEENRELKVAMDKAQSRRYAILIFLIFPILTFTVHYNYY